MISAVQGSRWVPLVLYSRDDLDPNADRFRAYVESGAQIPLANLLAETAMVRRRTGMLVAAALIPTRAFAPIIEVAQSSSYVAAPLVIEGRAVGFMHADRVGQAEGVDDEDRRLIEAFTAELGVRYQRAWWSERLAERQARAEHEIERATSGLRRVASDAGKLRVAGDQRSAGEALDDATPRPRRPDHRSLTRREWDVLAHVADGATNRVIAHRLTLSEDTVKTHLRHILRKLGVSGRASAVAWFLEVGRGAQ
jgi:DNA-binding CsgD family transcriptional regulator